MILRFMSSAATTPAVSLGPEQSILTRSAMKDRGKNIIRGTVCLFSFFFTFKPWYIIFVFE